MLLCCIDFIIIYWAVKIFTPVLQMSEVSMDSGHGTMPIMGCARPSISARGHILPAFPIKKLKSQISEDDEQSKCSINGGECHKWSGSNCSHQSQRHLPSPPVREKERWRICSCSFISVVFILFDYIWYAYAIVLLPLFCLGVLLLTHCFVIFAALKFWSSNPVLHIFLHLKSAKLLCYLTMTGGLFDTVH